jgi:hypothetical protein
MRGARRKPRPAGLFAVIVVAVAVQLVMLKLPSGETFSSSDAVAEVERQARQAPTPPSSEGFGRTQTVF